MLVFSSASLLLLFSRPQARETGCLNANKAPQLKALTVFTLFHRFSQPLALAFAGRGLKLVLCE